jgi:OOP family OmpA-OmpF porin
MKKILVAKGFFANDINATGQLSSPPLQNINDTLIGGIKIMAGQKISTRVADTMTLFAPKTVYFQTGQTSFTVTSELSRYLDDAKGYLQGHPEKKLSCTGYTDNKGNEMTNIALSKQRAEFVKAQLTRSGIPASQITVNGKGSANPVADNATAEGRSKNRRVEISIP